MSKTQTEKHKMDITIRVNKTKKKKKQSHIELRIPNGTDKGLRKYFKTIDDAEKFRDFYLSKNSLELAKLQSVDSSANWTCEKLIIFYNEKQTNRLESDCAEEIFGKQIGYRYSHNDLCRVRRILEIRVDNKKLAQFKPSEFNKHFLKHHVLAKIASWKNQSGKLLSGSTKRGYWTSLKTFLDLAIDKKCIEHNPMNLFRGQYPSKESTDERYSDESMKKNISLETLEAIFHALPDEAVLNFMFAQKTGLRSSERIALNWSDIIWIGKDTVKISVSKSAKMIGKNADGSAIFKIIDQLKTKAGKRIVPLTGAWLSMLKAEMIRQKEFCLQRGYKWNDNRAVFVNDRMQRVSLSGTTFYKQLQRACKNANVPPITQHMLRHAFASYWVNAQSDGQINNASWSTLARIIGHSDASLTQKVYTHHIADPDSISRDAETASKMKNDFVRKIG